MVVNTAGDPTILMMCPPAASQNLACLDRLQYHNPIMLRHSVGNPNWTNTHISFIKRTFR